MAQRMQIVKELKRVLQERGVTYAVVAKQLGLSLASVKRLFSTATFSLERIDAICELAGLEPSDLLARMTERSAPVSKLTLEQEREVVSDPKLLLVTWLVFNRTKFDNIIKRYTLTERELQRYLIRLDRLKIIELLPLNRVRLLVNRHYSWRAGGPVQKYIHQKLMMEFLDSNFTNEGDEFFFHGGAVSKSALSRMKKALQHAARECIEIIDNDQSPPDGQNGAAFVLSLRPWQFSGFAEYLRES
jgi:DNA-binding Xre family transcriptional regulator